MKPKCKKCGSENVLLSAYQDTRVWLRWNDEEDEWEEIDKEYLDPHDESLVCDDCRNVEYA